MSGKLILGATPIGNLGDISQRLLDTMNEVDEIWCEDTRVTRKLLQVFDIKKPLKAFHEFSTQAVSTAIQGRLKQGETLLYVSDAGMPGISDPGFELVGLARQIGIEVDVLPGPSAVLNALVLSGFPCHEFVFMGFFPEKKQARKNLIQRLQSMNMTSIHFESPKRIQRTLDELAELVPQTRIALCRELTKQYQETLIGTPQEVKQKLQVTKGEMVMVWEPIKDATPSSTPMDHFHKLVQEGYSPKEAVKLTSQTFSLKKRDVYSMVFIDKKKE